ncbi:uncharacterized protein LOC115953704 [Quercus lobata]|uniref:uncharacterized protein LOC115953704 n=1 Tax=Quercus lobata TaxID=97700 RepID=UPI001246C9DF|nr:uncharacterized protein LOC115953704 [Quercus lobata]
MRNRGTQNSAKLGGSDLDILMSLEEENTKALLILNENCTHIKGEPQFENKSKESGAGYTEMTLADSFTKPSGSMLEKRKHKAMGSVTKENGSVEQRKRKREKKINALIPSSNEHHLSSGIVGGLRAV